LDGNLVDAAHLRHAATVTKLAEMLNLAEPRETTGPAPSMDTDAVRADS
jgi:hypothetical protein